LLGGKTETDEAQEIISKSERSDSLNLVNQLSLNGSAYVTQKAKFLITHDTGLMHIGAALKVPILSIWGNTIPEFGMYPYYGDEQIPHIIQEIKNLSCRPCSKIGYAACPKGHFKCMEQQSVKEIISKVEELLKETI
jgi:heptosyltransferase-2